MSNLSRNLPRMGKEDTQLVHTALSLKERLSIWSTCEMKRTNSVHEGLNEFLRMKDEDFYAWFRKTAITS